MSKSNKNVLNHANYGVENSAELSASTSSADFNQLASISSAMAKSPLPSLADQIGSSSPSQRKKRRATPTSSPRVTKDLFTRRSRSRSGSPRKRHYRSQDSRQIYSSANNRRDRHRNDYSRNEGRKREFDRELIYGRRRSRSRSRDRYRQRKRSGSRDQSPISEFDKLAKKEREKTRKEGRPGSATASGVNSDSGTPTPHPTLANADSSPTASVDAEVTRTIEQLVRQRVDEEVRSKTADIEAEIQRRILAAKLDLETRIRQQVEADLRDEMMACEKREADAKQKCEQLERQLKAKMEETDEAKKKLDEDRLDMLESKRKLDEERNQMRKEKEKLMKEEQKVILGKGGARQKVEFSLNRKM